MTVLYSLTENEIIKYIVRDHMVIINTVILFSTNCVFHCFLSNYYCLNVRGYVPIVFARRKVIKDNNLCKSITIEIV